MTHKLSDHKLYPPVEGLRGDSGENPGTLAIVAVLDPSPHYPDCGRIIVGSPETSESDVAQFSCGPEVAVRLAATLEQAAADVDVAIDADAPPVVTASGAEPRCEVCCLPIVAGDRIQIFLEDDEVQPGTWIGSKQIAVHADRCPGNTTEADPAPALAAPAMPAPAIPALWFTPEGYGPSEIALRLHPFPAARPGRIPASLGLRVVLPSADAIVYVSGLVDGGFNLGREQVVELHRQIGEWLAQDGGGR